MDSYLRSPLREAPPDPITSPVTTSPLPSPPPSAKNPTPTPPSASPQRLPAAVTGSPLRSPLHSFASPQRPEAAMGSPRRSPPSHPPLRSLLAAPPSPIKEIDRNSGAIVVSTLRPPSPKKEISFGSQIASQREGPMTVGSIFRSPLSEDSPPPLAVEVAANRMTTEATPAARRERGFRVDAVLERRPTAVRRAAVGLRVSAAVLCLVSFSVMAADKTSGWAGDSFDRYKEFRYCLSVNVIAFAYSSFQVYVHVHHKMKRKRIMSRPMSYYFDLSMDQILAYLLMSASSSAASRNDDWVSSFGSDDFTDMINGSIAMSFLAFFALALSSVISAYKLFSWNF